MLPPHGRTFIGKWRRLSWTSPLFWIIRTGFHGWPGSLRGCSRTLTFLSASTFCLVDACFVRSMYTVGFSSVAHWSEYKPLSCKLALMTSTYMQRYLKSYLSSLWTWGTKLYCLFLQGCAKWMARCPRGAYGRGLRFLNITSCWPHAYLFSSLTTFPSSPIVLDGTDLVELVIDPAFPAPAGGTKKKFVPLHCEVNECVCPTMQRNIGVDIFILKKSPRMSAYDLDLWLLLLLYIFRKGACPMIHSHMFVGLSSSPIQSYLSPWSRGHVELTSTASW